MSIVVIGINHRTSPLELLEKVAIADESLPKVLHSLSVRNDIREVAVLSTCNRIEVYAVTERFHAAYADIRDFFCESSGLAPDDLHPHLYSQHDDAAVAHLFEVAAGLDSAVVGETEILGQVGDAWNVAMDEGTSKSTLNLLFRHALEVGKRARTETGISRSTASVSHAAVEMARDILGSLAEKSVLVVGAGEMGEGVAVALSGAGASGITVMNRTESRADHLVEKVRDHHAVARVAPLADLERELGRADVVVACTGAGDTVITAEIVERARISVTTPLLIVDIALPRDVEAAAATVHGVTLRDLHDLRDWAARGLEKRASEASKVRDIVGEEVERFVVEALARQAAPLISQLREQAEAVRRSEIERFSGRLADLSDEQRDIVESITRGIVAKLLHSPTVHLKESVGTPQAERLAAAVRDLFNLH